MIFKGRKSRKSQFGPDQFIMVVTISFWLRPNHYGQVQINLVRPIPFWTDQNCFGHIEGQGSRGLLSLICSHEIQASILYFPNLYVPNSKMLTRSLRLPELSLKLRQHRFKSACTNFLPKKLF